MPSFLYFTSLYPITSFVASQALPYSKYGSGYQRHNRETVKGDLRYYTKKLSVKFLSRIDERAGCLFIKEDRRWKKSLLSGFPVCFE